MTIYALYDTSTASADSVAQLDIQFDGHITAWHAALECQAVADAEGAAYEVSFLSSNTLTSNDSRGSILIVRYLAELTTSGATTTTMNDGLSGLYIPVTAGERIWVHAEITGTLTSEFNAHLYVEDAADPNLRRRR